MLGISNLIVLLSISALPPNPLLAIHRAKVAPLFCKYIIMLNLFNKAFLLLHPYIRIHWILFIKPICFQIWLECPLIPNVHVILEQVLDICVAFKEPQKLVDNASSVHFFGGNKW